MTCENCRYYDVDYEWDGDYEYIEKDTECDNCEFLQECRENGYVFNISTGIDSREHFIPGLRLSCKKIMGGQSK